MFRHDERTLHPIADVESFGQAVTGNRSAKPLPEVSKTSSDSMHNETKFNESPPYTDGQHTCISSQENKFKVRCTKIRTRNFIAIRPLELIDVNMSNAVRLI